MSLKLELLDYQKKGVLYALKAKYCIIGDSMGLGKTLQALTVSDITKYKTLVVCPTFLKNVWIKEIEKCLDLSHKIRITSYSQLKNAEPLFKWAELIICDEAHYLKNPKAIRTKAVHYFIEHYRPKMLLCLTGTPIKNRIIEFYSLLMLMDKCPIESNGKRLSQQLKYYSNFCYYFSHQEVKTAKGRNFVTYSGVRNLPEFKKLLKGKYIRRVAEQVLDLPPLQRINIPSNLSHAKNVTELEKAWSDYESGKAASHFSTAKANNALLKAPFTSEFVQNLVDQGESVVVFTDHVESAKYLKMKIKNSALITGAIGEKERIKIITDFNKGKIKVLVGTISTVSVGYTLTIARYAVFNDLPWVSGDIMQAEKRIHRIGQDRGCIIYRIFASKIDEYIIDKLTNKMRVLEKVL